MRLTRAFIIIALALSIPRLAIPLLADDGDLDPLYGDGGVAHHVRGSDSLIRGLACAPEGTCYISAEASGDFRAREFNAHGLYNDVEDAFFDLGGGNLDSPWGLGVGADGKPVIAGSAEDAVDLRMAVARFTHGPDLELDTDFSGDGRVTQPFVGDAEARAVAIGPSGEIVIAGTYITGGATGRDFAVMRFLPNGTPDPGFDGNGVRTIDFNHGTGGDNDFATSVAILPDGRIVVAGQAQFSGTDSDFAVARLHPNGSLDMSFSGDGKQTVSFDQGTTDEDGVEELAIDRFGRIVLGGYAEIDGGHRPALARLSSNGNLDLSFGNTLPTPDGKFLGSEGTLAISIGVAALPFPSERILFLTLEGTLTALTDAGQLDPSFGDGGTIVVVDPGAAAPFPARLTTLGGMPLVAGQSYVSEVENHFIARYWMNQIFGDDFESGNTNAWRGW